MNTSVGHAQGTPTITCGLQACREYIAYLQEVADQEESEVESYKCVHEHVLMESQSQMDHLKAAFQVSVCGAFDIRQNQDCFLMYYSVVKSGLAICMSGGVPMKLHAGIFFDSKTVKCRPVTTRCRQRSSKLQLMSIK